jgi:hypothetical protein
VNGHNQPERRIITMEEGDEARVRRATSADSLALGVEIGTSIIELAHKDGSLSCYEAAQVRIVSRTEPVATVPVPVPVPPGATDDIGLLTEVLHISRMQTEIAVALLETAGLVQEYRPWTLAVADILRQWQQLNPQEQQKWHDGAEAGNCTTGLHYFTYDYGQDIDYAAFGAFRGLDLPADNEEEGHERIRRVYWKGHLNQLAKCQNGARLVTGVDDVTEAVTWHQGPPPREHALSEVQHDHP